MGARFRHLRWGQLQFAPFEAGWGLWFPTQAQTGRRKWGTCLVGIRGLPPLLREDAAPGHLRWGQPRFAPFETEWGNTKGQLNNKSAAQWRRFCGIESKNCYNVDSISKPQASRRASGMYFEFLFRRAHSRSRVERMY
jgi:hypothetical protein